MSRATAAAVVTTALIGLTGGGVTAVVRGADRQETPTSTASPIAPGESAVAGADRLLWTEGRFVHDGSGKVALSGVPVGVPSRLVRAADGYVVAYDDARDEDELVQQLYFVPADTGRGRELGRARSWDLDEAGETVALVRSADGLVVTVGRDGRQQARWEAPTTQNTLVWTGGDVVVHGVDAELGWTTHVWTPASGEHAPAEEAGFEGAIGSRDGRRVLGRVSSDGWSAVGDGGNSCLRVAVAPGEQSGPEWLTCDWRLNSLSVNPLSPDASRVLVVPVMTDGFGPGVFGVVDVAAGPPAGVRTIDLPDFALDGAWLDGDRVAVVGATSDDAEDSGGWIAVCEVSRGCRVVERTGTGRIVVGEQF